VTKGSHVVDVDVFTPAAGGKMNDLSPAYNVTLTHEHNLPGITSVISRQTGDPIGVPNQKAFKFVLHY
jgi:hypothetical protein